VSKFAYFWEGEGAKDGSKTEKKKGNYKRIGVQEQKG
jgi:hypothetical protein